ncbi:hypothetical protein VNO77_30069 [Canavalia gladiata]|uniref:Uncharacterized protein n=1 Tax=Canavalia gladiata TaxID=3824 RepID=A0AAN9KMR2_CANGL
MEGTKWVVQINEDLIKNNGSSVHENEQWKRHSIYKIPSRVTSLNEKAYKPQAVSFGPYHYGEEHLKDMEVHKHRALLHFLKRSKKPIEFIFHRMDQVVDELRDSYNPLDPIWMQDTPRFLQIMILDGCFMLEILRVNDSISDDYVDNDPVFGEHGKLYVMPYIKRDMLMLENQLPLMVLRILIEVDTDTSQGVEELLKKQIVKFLSPGTHKTEKIGKCTHALDVFRKSLIEEGPTRRTRVPKSKRRKWLSEEQGEEIIRSATELQEAGIGFKKSRTNSLRDVSFVGGVLRLPTLVIDDTTEYMLLNLIALERLHVGEGNEVTSYIFFMDTMIDNEMDVALLHRTGILINALGSDKAVAKLFNSLSKDITVDGEGVLDVVRVSMSNYCKKPWNKWRANLIHTYFRNPWAIVSLVAAIFLFALTIVQTVYTIAQFYQSPTPPPPPPSSPFPIPTPRPSHHRP